MAKVYAFGALALFLGMWSFGGFMAYFQGSTSGGAVILLPIGLALATAACVRQAAVQRTRLLGRAQRDFATRAAAHQPDRLKLDVMFSALAELRPKLITVQGASGTLSLLSDDSLLFESRDGFTTARIRRADVLKIETDVTSTKIRMVPGAPYLIEVTHTDMTRGEPWSNWYAAGTSTV